MHALLKKQNENAEQEGNTHNSPVAVASAALSVLSFFSGPGLTTTGAAGLGCVCNAHTVVDQVVVSERSAQRTGQRWLPCSKQLPTQPRW